jgi:uncharacterized protein YbcI
MRPVSSDTTFEPNVSAVECRDICRDAVRIWKEKVGRGPNYAKAFAIEAGIAMVFRDVLTQVERELVAAGGEDAVRQMRREVFENNRDRLIEAVEQTSGHTVETVLYDVSPQHDTSGFLFLFAARPAPLEDRPAEHAA